VHYFVTGATGFVGGYLTSQLLAAGHEVTALVASREEARDIAVYGVRPHVGSVTDKEAMRRGVRGVDGVFHTAGHRLMFGDRATMRAVNVQGTKNVLELVKEHGIPKIVFTSTLNAFGDTGGEVVDEGASKPDRWPTEYDEVRGAAHFDVALPMADAGLPIVTLLPGMVYGPRDTSAMAGLLARAMLGKVWAISAAPAYSWAHVMDVAHAHVLAMQFGRPGESYVIGGPAHTVREAIEVAAEAAGKKRKPVPVPPWMVAPAATVVGALARIVTPWRPIADRLRVAAGVTYLASDAKAREELGFEPRSLRDGLPDAARALLEDMLGDAD
jgi:nucleoside-diphosphate-sugar epimerase